MILNVKIFPVDDGQVLVFGPDLVLIPCDGLRIRKIGKTTLICILLCVLKSKNSFELR